MKKITIFFVLLIIFIPNTLYSADKNNSFDGKGGRDDLSFLNVKNSNFKKGIDSLKIALKHKKKQKNKKADKKFEKALNYFILANKEKPNDIEILKLLGFVHHMVNDEMMSEIYYLQGLDIDPKNNFINEKLGELYYNTQRISLAKERLKALATCNCEEYSKLMKIIQQ